MSDIFISYAREDQAKAEAIAHGLEQKGWSIWWDRTIPAGKWFHQVIERELAEARCVLALWSANSVTSSWVRDEATEALKRDILLPILLEAVDPPMGFRSMQAANLISWNESPNSPLFQKLVSDIEAELGPPRLVAPESAEVAASEAVRESGERTAEQLVDQEAPVALAGGARRQTLEAVLKSSKRKIIVAVVLTIVAFATAMGIFSPVFNYFVPDEKTRAESAKTVEEVRKKAAIKAILEEMRQTDAERATQKAPKVPRKLEGLDKPAVVLPPKN